MKLLTMQEMRDLEAAANRGGLAYDTMMERAGRATAQVVRDYLPANGQRVLILVGPGNNGGDGLVAARHLAQWGYEVTVYIWRRSLAEDPNLARVEGLSLAILRADDDAKGQLLREQVAHCDALIDALLGTGIVGGLRGGLPKLLEWINAALAQRALDAAETVDVPVVCPERRVTRSGARVRPLIVAVDLPSGLDSDTGEIDPLALQADCTVTFAHPKRGHYLYPGADWVGELWVADIGIAAELAKTIPLDVATAEAVARTLPKRPSQGHKGTFGKAMVVAGSLNYVGAPHLAAEAAYRVGAGLVTLGIPAAIHGAVSARLIEATFILLPHELGALKPSACPLLREGLRGYSALLVGPGLGQAPETAAFLWRLLTQASKRSDIGFAQPASEPHAEVRLPPLVLDADGLNLLAAHEGWHKALPPDTVLTPHPGEMARLLGCDIAAVNADRLTIARQAALQWGCTVLLKGAYSVVAGSDGRQTVLPFANPALASGGTGDVLAGAIVGLMAQGMAGYEAAVAGAFLHAQAGESWRREVGDRGLLASELLPRLPQALAGLTRDRG